MNIEYVCLTNSDLELKNNLLRSENISEIDLKIIKGAKNASKALNDVINLSKSDYLIIVHQDVFLPQNWQDLLKLRLEELNTLDPKWAVAGPFGRSEKLKKNVGCVYSSSLGGIVGNRISESIEVDSLDELAIFINMKSGINFEPNLPSFHLYGTEIILIAKSMGFKSYAVNFPLVHNDKFKPGLGLGFFKSYLYMRKKWKNSLPITTPVTIIKRDLRHILKGYYFLFSTKKNRKLQSRCHMENPEIYWEEYLNLRK